MYPHMNIIKQKKGIHFVSKTLTFSKPLQHPLQHLFNTQKHISELLLTASIVLNRNITPLY